MEKLSAWLKDLNVYTSEYPTFAFERVVALDTLRDHFKLAGLSGFGVDEGGPAVCAAGALMDYLKETQKNALAHINAIQTSSQSEYMALDMFTAQQPRADENAARGQGARLAFRRCSITLRQRWARGY